MPKGRPPVERVTVACFVCEKKIVKRKTDADRNISQRFFCSQKCLWKVGAKPRRRKERKCEWCKQVFYPRHAAEDPARFCSKACHDEWQRRNRREITCETCGTVTVRKPFHAKTARFCSKACEAESRVKRPLNRLHNGRPVRLNTQGYPWVYEPDHPKANRDGWIAEHRIVAEGVLGRLLGPDDHVHHINADKQDNRPKNLAVMTHLEHAAVTGRETQRRIREWEEYRSRYGPLQD